METTPTIPCSLCSGWPSKQAVGREKRALVVLGEAIDKWEGTPEAAKGGGGACRENGRDEAFFDRGVIRYKGRNIPASYPQAGYVSELPKVWVGYRA